MNPVSEVSQIDCMEGMKAYPDKFFDWVVADVPYGLNAAKMAFTQRDKMPVRQRNGKVKVVSKKAYALKSWDVKAPNQDYFDEVCRVSKNQIIFGVEYVNWMGLGKGRIKWDKCVNEGVGFKKYEMAYCSAIDDLFEFKLL